MTFPKFPTSAALSIATAAALGLASSMAMAATASDKPAAKPATTTVAAADTSKAAKPAAPAVRDWKQVDTNNDNLVSPEEMEAFLAKVR